MAVGTDRFTVTSVRPEAHLHTSEVPQDLPDRVKGKIVTAEEPDAGCKTSRLYHGGESLVDASWHGQAYLLYLEPVAGEDV